MPAERAGYTVTMFLIDVSPSMGNLRSVEVQGGTNGQTRSVAMTNLEWSLQFALLKVQEMIFHGRKTDQCGVILFGTEKTDNIINESSGGYEHVSEYIEIAQPNASTLTKLQALQPSTVIGDPIDAIIVGIETQDKYLGKKKSWTRRMVLLTDGENPIEIEDWELTVKKINSLDIVTTIIGIDFDDEAFGLKEEDKSIVKRENERFFHEFVSSIKEGYGVIGTAAFALQECVRPDVKMTKSSLLGTTLRLGDVDTRSNEAISLPIKTSKCTAVIRPASLKKFVKRVPPEEEALVEGDVEGDNERKDVYAQLGMQTEYFLSKEEADEEDADKKSEDESGVEKVDKEQLIRGFKYGASYAPCPDGQFPCLNTRKGIDICGFFPDKFVRRDLAIGEVQYVWADQSSGQTQVAFSSIVQAMLARDVVAIARWVTRDEMDPKMGLLIPRDFEKVDCFLWLQMPFADDVRKYAFPSLDNLVSKKGEPVTKYPFIPTQDQMMAMDHFVDAMDLMQAGDKDEEGQRMPWFDPRLSYNPAVHRIKQALFHAAVVTDLRANPLPPPHPEITKYFEPPRRVLKRAHDDIEECESSFKVKQVPKRVIRQRKDGHVRDDDELLLLDQPKHLLPKSQSRSQDFAHGNNGNSEIKDSEHKMDIDGDIDIDTDGEAPEARVGRADAALVPTPESSIADVSQTQFNGEAPSQDIAFDDGRALGRMVGVAHPLIDFQNGIKNAGSLAEATEDLVSVIKDVILKPFASRREKEMIECMRELRSTCLNKGSIDTWNSFVRDLKKACLSSILGNASFWKTVRSAGRSLSLIGRSEAEASGNQSDVADEEVEKFVRM